MEPRTQFVCFLFSFYLILTKGSQVKQLFAQTGSDVTLDITDPKPLEDYLVLQWKFNTSIILVTAPKNGEVTINRETAAYHSQNFSLTLKNLQEEESGLYQAGLITPTENPIIAHYSITVQAPVSPVRLRVDPVSNSSESCNFTVSCTTESSNISRSFTCDRHNCDPTITNPAHSLHVYLSDVSIICNHSNHVSWKNDTKDIKQVCPLFGSKGPSEEETGPTLSPIHTALIVLVFCAAGAAGGVAVLFRKKRQNSQSMSVPETLYDSPERLSPQPTSDTEVIENPTSTYSLVGPHSGPVPAPASLQSPESLYATVNKPQNANPYSMSAA